MRWTKWKYWQNFMRWNKYKEFKVCMKHKSSSYLRLIIPLEMGQKRFKPVTLKSNIMLKNQMNLKSKAYI